MDTSQIRGQNEASVKVLQIGLVIATVKPVPANLTICIARIFIELLRRGGQPFPSPKAPSQAF